MPTPTPFPVDVTGSLASDVPMVVATAVLAVITLALFLATFLMAKKTAELAQDTVDASNLADEHHQQTLWPFIVVTKWSVQAQQAPELLNLQVKNIGSGVALAVRATLVAINTQGLTIAPNFLLGAVGPGELYPRHNETIAIQFTNSIVRGQDVFNIQVLLEYDTMFGSTGSQYWSWNREPEKRGEGFTLGWTTPTLPPILKRAKRPIRKYAWLTWLTSENTG
jgi:hypothetical protein